MSAIMTERRQARLVVIDDDPAVRSGYDLVVTDLTMPGLSGWEVAEAVRSASPGTPVILVTGSATDVDAQRAGALGLALLHKPVPLEELQRAVRQALGRLGPGNAAD